MNFFLFSSTICYSAFYKVLSFAKPSKTGFIFAKKIQFKLALPILRPL